MARRGQSRRDIVRQLTIRFHDFKVRIPAAAAEAPRLKPLQLMVEPFSAAIGTLNRGCPWRTPMIRFQGKPVPYDSPQLFEHLGQVAQVNLADEEYYIGLPRPEQMFRRIELLRRQWFNNLRETFNKDADRMTNAFMANRVFDPTKQDAYYVAQIAVCDLLLVYLAEEYGIEPEEHTGWRSGLMLEKNVMLQRLPPQSAWHPRSVAFFKRFDRAVVEPGAFVLPGIGEARGGQEKTANSQKADQPDRLFFSMSLPPYKEPRLLKGGRYNYIAIVFTDDPETGLARVGLDTVKYGHRFIGLCGDLHQCLELAQHSTITQLREHPWCRCKPVHDDQGRWKDDVQRWLRC